MGRTARFRLSIHVTVVMYNAMLVFSKFIHGHLVCYLYVPHPHNVKICHCRYWRDIRTVSCRDSCLEWFCHWNRFPCQIVRTITVFIRRTCRCDWRSQKLGVHWASQSSSFWPIKLRNKSAALYCSANERGTKRQKQVRWPVLWTTWWNGTVRMTFRKKWTSRKVRRRLLPTPLLLLLLLPIYVLIIICTTPVYCF